MALEDAKMVTVRRNPFRAKYIAHLGFTQTCRKVRAEFRDDWLDSLTVSLDLVDGFVRCFLFETSHPWKAKSASLRTAGVLTVKLKGEQPCDILALVQL